MQTEEHAETMKQQGMSGGGMRSIYIDDLLSITKPADMESNLSSNSTMPLVNMFIGSVQCMFALDSDSFLNLVPYQFTESELSRSNKFDACNLEFDQSINDSCIGHY